jgi:hypothetical protein
MQIKCRAVSAQILLPAALLLLAWPSSLPAQAADASRLRPAELVRRFCRLDFDGVRLSSKSPSADAFARLVGGEGDWPEEPIRIVSSFRVLSVTENQDAATVRVAFELRGQLTGALESDALILRRTSENIEFSLFRADGLWKVKAFDLPPHVSARALRDHIQQILNDDQQQGDTHRQALLEKLISKLKSTGP